MDKITEYVSLFNEKFKNKYFLEKSSTSDRYFYRTWSKDRQVFEPLIFDWLGRNFQASCLIDFIDSYQEFEKYMLENLETQAVLIVTYDSCDSAYYLVNHNDDYVRLIKSLIKDFNDQNVFSNILSENVNDLEKPSIEIKDAPNDILRYVKSLWKNYEARKQEIERENNFIALLDVAIFGELNVTQTEEIVFYINKNIYRYNIKLEYLNV